MTLVIWPLSGSFLEPIAIPRVSVFEENMLADFQFHVIPTCAALPMSTSPSTLKGFGED